MPTLEQSHLAPDTAGVLRVGNVKFIMFVTLHVRCKMDAAALAAHYPALSLGQIHGALAYYYDNQAAFDEELKRRDNDADTVARTQPSDVFRQRVLKLKALYAEQQRLDETRRADAGVVPLAAAVPVTR